MSHKSKTHCHQVWVKKAGKQRHPGGAPPPPSSSTPAESFPNSTPSGETYRASNDALVGRSGLMKNSGKMSAHGRIQDEFEFDRGSASSHHRLQKNSTLNTRFDPEGEGIHLGKTENSDKGNTENVDKGNSWSLHLSSSSFGGYGVKVSLNTRFDPEGGGIHLGKTENSDKGNTENVDKGNSWSLHLNSSSFGGYGVKVGTSGKVFNSEESGSGGQTEDSEFRYDICPMRSGSGVKLKTPLLLKTRELRKENSRNSDGHCIHVLRSGMLLLKNYISLKDQVKVIRKCRELGLGPGGFYLPGYENGAKLRLRMMCLGKNWDPETSTYGDKRPSDEAKPPPVPEEFRSLVKKAIGECHSHLVHHCRQRNVEHILPSMTPNICIVNFYTKTGRLGLHQDKDESQESLRRGLPVVSFSIGDSAEFLFGDERNVDKVEKIILESGDVLIFGGEARHIFHGVSTILPDTAPNYLQEETNLRSGRLNLTFKEY